MNILGGNSNILILKWQNFIRCKYICVNFLKIQLFKSSFLCSVKNASQDLSLFFPSILCHWVCFCMFHRKVCFCYYYEQYVNTENLMGKKKTKLFLSIFLNKSAFCSHMTVISKEKLHNNSYLENLFNRNPFPPYKRALIRPLGFSSDVTAFICFKTHAVCQ